MSMADVGAGGEEAVVTFDGIAILTPRLVKCFSCHSLLLLSIFCFRVIDMCPYAAGVVIMLSFISHSCACKGKQMTLKFSIAA